MVLLGHKPKKHLHIEVTSSYIDFEEQAREAELIRTGNLSGG